MLQPEVHLIFPDPERYTFSIGAARKQFGLQVRPEHQVWTGVVIEHPELKLFSSL
jgi:hypothetical protein